MEDILDFKWDRFAKYVHFLGFGMHVFYIGTLYFFIAQCYMVDIYGEQIYKNTEYILLVGIVYPTIYDLIQLYNAGWADYFNDVWNLLDVCFYVSGILNFVSLLYCDDMKDFHVILSFCVVILLSL